MQAFRDFPEVDDASCIGGKELLKIGVKVLVKERAVERAERAERGRENGNPSRSSKDEGCESFHFKPPIFLVIPVLLVFTGRCGNRADHPVFYHCSG